MSTEERMQKRLAELKTAREQHIARVPQVYWTQLAQIDAAIGELTQLLEPEKVIEAEKE